MYRVYSSSRILYYSIKYNVVESKLMTPSPNFLNLYLYRVCKVGALIPTVLLYMAASQVSHKVLIV